MQLRCRILKLATAATSHHLALLRAGRLVVPERRGRNVYYRTDPRAAKALLGDLKRVLVPGRGAPPWRA